jgi:uncharacterized protein with PQ loop repeat
MAADSMTMFVGGVAAICTCFSFVPQLAKIRRQGGDDLSNGMLGLYLLGLALWLVYGVRIQAAEVIAANIVGGSLVIAALVMKRRFRASADREARKRAQAGTLADADCTTAMRERVKALRSDNVRRWGRMTAHQMVCHLLDCNRMALGELVVTPPPTRIPRAITKWVSLYTPLPWPKGLPTNPELDQDVAGTRPGDFAADVVALETTVDQLTSQASRKDWPPHPDFGAMSEADWLRWGYRHMDHHLRQFGG